mmetsp:Transcript_3885/g.9730  ORF Transcript_3885/g.9730 Transcript_3885/m.9730 type:complete len:247 (+) Transcript_3885:246-986(+)
MAGPAVDVERGVEAAQARAAAAARVGPGGACGHVCQPDRGVAQGDRRQPRPRGHERWRSRLRHAPPRHAPCRRLPSRLPVPAAAPRQRGSAHRLPRPRGAAGAARCGRRADECGGAGLGLRHARPPLRCAPPREPVGGGGPARRPRPEEAAARTRCAQAARPRRWRAAQLPSGQPERRPLEPRRVGGGARALCWRGAANTALWPARALRVRGAAHLHPRAAGCSAHQDGGGGGKGGWGLEGHLRLR